MAIYIDDIGQGELPLQINNPQDGESLVWSEELGAYVNAPGGGASTEQIQDTVAEMLEVDSAGTQVSLRLVSTYDDVAGKLTFNVVSGGGTGGSGPGSIIVKENGATRGVATTLDFIGPSISFNQGVATLTGMLDSVLVKNAGTNIGDVGGFNFEGFEISVADGIATVVAPQGAGTYTLPTASTVTKGGVKIDGTTIVIDGNGVISAVGGGGGIDLTALGNYLTTNGYATQSYVTTQISNIVDGAPTLLNTLNELAAALADNPNFASDVLLKTGGTMTGALTLSGDPTLDLQAATKKYVDDKFTTTAPVTVSPSFASAVASQVSLGSLSGVSVGSISAGQILGFDGSNWVPTANSGAKGDKGDTGNQGPQGLSISAATVTLAGRLQLTLSDNTVVDAGNVSGIKSAIINGSGELVLTKQDNTTINAGSVVGTKGDTGNAATVTVGSVITGTAGSSVSVTNSGTSNAATLNFNIPRGDKGDTGVGFSAATVNGSGELVLTKTDSSTVNAGSVIGPKGDTGTKGDAGTITIGAVATGAEGTDVEVTNTGTSSSATLNFTIPKGDTGVGIYSAVVNSSGNLILTLTDTSTIDAGSIQGPKGDKGNTGNAGVQVTAAAVSGDDLNITLSDSTVLNAGNVRGPKGDQGNQGNAGTISVGSVTTGAAGSSVSITNAGTSSAATLNFTIPQGAKGDTGTSYTVNGKSGSVQIYGVQNTTQPGYDLEVDLSNKAGKLNTARNISLSGKVTGLVSFDGSANVTMTTALNSVTTSDISEGTNKYYTDVRARAAHSAIADSNISSLIAYDDLTGVIKYRANTSYITEGSNLYFTNTRADARADVRIAASSINALSDVDTVTAAPTNGQVLTWTGSAWTPSTVAGGSGAVASVNSKTGTVSLNTDDIGEGSNNLYYTTTRFDSRFTAKSTDNLTEGTTNKYFSNTLARGALGAGTGIAYNSGTGTISLNANTDNVTEGSSNLYYTNSRFDTRLGQSNLNAFADVSNTTPTTGQALAWNGSTWAPTTITSGGGGGSSSSGIFRATVQVDYDASGNLSSVSVLSGGISAAIATATSTTATVTFTFTDSVCAPLGIQVYGYQRASNIYVTRSIGSDYTSRTMAGGGSSGSPTAFSAFDASVNTMTLSLTKALTGASASVGATTHCVVHFLLSNV